MKILAVIPARGGSKGIPRKNITNLGGKSLIDYTITAATSIDGLRDVVVSTEDDEIAAIVRELGLDVPFMRPESLAKDSTESAPVIIHALKSMEEYKGIQYDAVLMLQPTSPLRRAIHIEKSLDLFKSKD